MDFSELFHVNAEEIFAARHHMSVEEWRAVQKPLMELHDKVDEAFGRVSFRKFRCLFKKG